MTPTQDRAQELLNLWDALRSSRSCIHVVDIQEHKDNLQGLANCIRLGLYAQIPTTSLDQACNEFELEYLKVKNKIHNDLIDGLRAK